MRSIKELYGYIIYWTFIYRVKTVRCPGIYLYWVWTISHITSPSLYAWNTHHRQHIYNRTRSRPMRQPINSYMLCTQHKSGTPTQPTASCRAANKHFRDSLNSPSVHLWR